jgi:outer membrane protein TolC
VITAYQNVADTLHAIQSDADALSTTDEAGRAAKKVLNITQKQYELGYCNYLALLSAEEAEQQALLTLLLAMTNRYGDTVALFQALGGGWWSRTSSGVTQGPCS